MLRRMPEPCEPVISTCQPAAEFSSNVMSGARQLAVDTANGIVVIALIFVKALFVIIFVIVFVVVVLVENRDDGALHDRVDVALVVDDHGSLDERAQVSDAGLGLALLLFGGVVVAVLAEVAHLACRFDLAGDVDAPLGGEVNEFGLQAVVGGLGELVLVHGHATDSRRGVEGRPRL